MQFLVTREQTLVKYENIRIQRWCKNIWILHVIRSPTIPSFRRLDLPQPSYSFIKTLQDFYKMFFALSFIMALYWKFQHVPLCRVFTNWVTYMFDVYMLHACMHVCVCMHMCVWLWYKNLTFTCVWYESFWTNFSWCHSLVSRKQIINIYIYTHVTLESLSEFIRSLASCTQGLNKFVKLLLSFMGVLNKFVGPLMNCMRAHDLMHSWSALLARNLLCYM